MRLDTPVTKAFEWWDTSPPKPAPKKAAVTPVTPRAQPKPSTRTWFPWQTDNPSEIAFRGSSDDHGTLALELHNIGSRTRRIKVITMSDCWEFNLIPGQTHAIVKPDYDPFQWSVQP